MTKGEQGLNHDSVGERAILQPGLNGTRALVHRRTLLASTISGMAARASAQSLADVVFPRGAAIGLRPPPGMAVSPRFSGFAEPGLPAATHPVHAATFRFDENPLEPASTTLAGAADIVTDHGVNVVSSRIVPHPDGFATLHHGTSAYTADERSRVQVLVLSQPQFMALTWFNAPPGPGIAYPPDVVDAALLSVRTRPQPSLSDRLASLTFSMADLAGLTVGDTSSSGGFTTGAMLTGGDGDAFVQVHRQQYQPIPVPAGLTPGEALRASFWQPRRDPPRFDEPIGDDGWWFDELDGQPGLPPEGLPWSITLLRWAPNGYLQVRADAHPRVRATLLPRLRRLQAGLAPR